MEQKFRNYTGETQNVHKIIPYWAQFGRILNSIMRGQNAFCRKKIFVTGLQRLNRKAESRS